jgi:hypothetical protein
MPQKINMFITNGKVVPRTNPAAGINYSNLTVAPTTPIVPSTLNSSMIGRIHSIKPGCGSCGRK